MRSSSLRAFCFFLLLLRSSTLQIGSPRSCLFISCLFLCSSALQIGSPRSCLFLCSLALQISLPRSTHPDRASSDRARFFGAPDRASSDLFFLCSSSDCSRSILLQNRVLETRFCFFELKSYRLEIYVALYCLLTKWESSL